MLTVLKKFAFSTRKDYYKLLNIPKDASTEEIKNAYIQQAKIYHPDVRSDNLQTANVEKFKDIAEAYAVLSIQESKISYDLLNTEQPDMINLSKRDQYLKKMYNRGVDGQRVKDANFNSFEQKKRQIMKDERKKFNVDEFGRYKGGLPQKGLGYYRNNSMGIPGSLHDPLYHNFAINPIPDNEFITKQDALHFKHYQTEDAGNINRQKFWFPAKVDYEFTQFTPWKIMFRWTRNILILLFGIGTCFEIFIRRSNREILQQLRQMAKSKQKIQSVNGKKIRRSVDGVYSIV